jgi:hypothetical protein
MKYAAVIAGAVLAGLQWHSEWGWFILSIVTVFIINIIKDNEQKSPKDLG